MEQIILYLKMKLAHLLLVLAEFKYFLFRRQCFICIMSAAIRLDYFCGVRHLAAATAPYLRAIRENRPGCHRGGTTSDASLSGGIFSHTRIDRQHRAERKLAPISAVYEHHRLECHEGARLHGQQLDRVSDKAIDAIGLMAIPLSGSREMTRGEVGGTIIV